MMKQHGRDAGAEGTGNNFDDLVRNLIDDKYNREYKLDRKTRAKALEILKDYYTKNLDEDNVSKTIEVWHLARSFKYLNLYDIRHNHAWPEKSAFSDLHCGICFILRD